MENNRSTGTRDETSKMEAAQLEAVEEQQQRRKARWLLKNFRKFLEQKHKQEEAMKNTPLFTKDDALYVLSGMAAHKGGERVQTSNISNAPETAAMNVDETLERMNREVRADVAKGYDQLCERISLVNAALMLLETETRNAAIQLYCKGVKWNKVVAPDGHYYSKKKVYAFINAAEESVIETILHSGIATRNQREEKMNEE